MRRVLLMIIILALGIVACGEDEDSESDKQPTHTPAPTSIGVGMEERLLNPLADPLGEEDCELDGEDGDCGPGGASVAFDDALPLPLTPQTVVGVQIGVPEGFEAVSFNDDNGLIHTEDSEQYPGNFAVSLQWLESAERVDEILSGYVNLHRSDKTFYETELGEGYTMPNGEWGRIGVWETTGGRYLMLDAVVDPGYWPLYAATFREMLNNLAPAEG